MNRSDSLELLDLLTSNNGMTRRVPNLLRNPKGHIPEEWFMHLPPCFNDALDIKFSNKDVDSKWTQGGNFSFKRGDLIYDTPKAYFIWGEALKWINLAVQVKSASSTGLGENRTRFSGDVEFSVLLPTRNRQKINEGFRYFLTQDRFVKFLICGPTGDLAEKIEEVRLATKTQTYEYLDTN